MIAGPPEHRWRECYARLAPKLLLFARQWVPCQADAEDVVQIAFVRFWRRQPTATEEHYPLLFAAVRTTALDWRRKHERRVRRELLPEAMLTSEALLLFDNTLEQQENAATIEAALARLPEIQREVVVLRIWGELTFAEIGTALGESINTVASRYRTGLETLRKSFRHNAYERL
jgi:RNA polymerase sigma-70 factor (ECF subfamily)